MESSIASSSSTSLPGTTESTESAEKESQKVRTFSRKDLTAKQWLQLTLAEAPSEPIEALFGLLSLSWGLWVMVPWWSVFGLAPGLYRGLLFLIPDEFIWGSLAAILGAVMLHALFADDRAARFWCAVSLTSLWGAFGVAFWFSEWRSPGGIFYFWLTAGSAWLIRRTRDKWLAEQRLRSQQRSQARQKQKQQQQQHQQQQRR